MPSRTVSSHKGMAGMVLVVVLLHSCTCGSFTTGNSFREGHDIQIAIMCIPTQFQRAKLFQGCSPWCIIHIDLPDSLIVESGTLVGQKPRFLQIFHHHFDFDPSARKSGSVYLIRVNI